MLETIIKIIIFLALAVGAVYYYKKTKSEKNNVFRVLICVVVLLMVLSYLIPGSMIDYNYGTVTADAVVPMGITSLFNNISTALNLSITMIVYLAIVGIFYAIIKKSGKYEGLVDNTAFAFKKNKPLFIVLTILVLGLFSSVTGEMIALAIFVPFLISVIRRLGYSKEVSVISTVGALLLGQAGAIYSSYLFKSLEITYSDNMLAKVVITAIVLVFLIAFILLFNKKPTPEKEIVKSKETKLLPIYITFGVVFVLLFMGFFPWNEYFGITGFEDFLTSIREAEFLKVSIFDAIVGNSTAIAAFGSWQLINAGVLFIVVDIVLAIVYKVWSVDVLVEGIKKAVPYMAITVLSYLVIVLTMNSGIYYTLTMGVTKTAINIFTVGTTALVSALNISEYTYATNFTLVAISSSVKFAKDADTMNLISVVYQSIYSVFMIVSPVSILLLFGLHYTDIKYKDWLKYILKFFGVLLITILVVTKLIIEGFDVIGIIALSLLIIGLVLIILMKLVFSKKIVFKIEKDDEPVVKKEEVKEVEVKEVETKKAATKKPAKKPTTKKTAKK
ncbi:MAG: hypothetical protein IKF36_05000 [Bacilli bacterium]|nr:hypothetical protein [Bacilli bacterium]